MKKVIPMLCILLLLMSSIVGCGQDDKSVAKKNSETKVEESQESKQELKKLRVAVMPFFLSAPVNYIKEQGWDKEAGLDMELVLFSNGATMNEALAANLWDVAPTGGAAIFGVASFGAKFIADFVDGTGGNEIYVRGDSDIAKVKGFNPTYPELLGNPETVKGKIFLYTAGTTSQMCMVKYLEAMGVPDDEMEMVHLEMPQAYQGFLAGQGDFTSMVSPYVFMAEEHGWVQAASLETLGAGLFETVITTPQAYEGMKEELAIFLNLLYRANEELENNKDLKFNTVKNWYINNGTEVDDTKVQDECDLKSFITKADLENIEYGKFQKEYAEFLVSIDKLTVDQVDIVVENTKSDILDMMENLD